MPFLRYGARLKEAEAGPLTLALPRPIDQSAQFALSLAFVGFLPSPRSQCVKERETSENVETRLVTGIGCCGHTLQYGQMRRHFRSGITWNELG